MATIYQQAAAFVQEIEALNTRALALLAVALARLLPRLQAEAEEAAIRIAVMRAADESPSRLQEFAAQRARQLAVEVEREIGRLVEALPADVRAAQAVALLRGGMDAEAILSAAVEEGSALAFTRAPLEAVRAAVGSQQGETLTRLFSALSADVGRRVRDSLNAGLISGRNPRAIGRELRQTVGLTASRAEVIARTETLRAYRVATLMAYEANGVTSYRRLSAKNSRTCALCLALDGRVQRTDEVMPAHPQCRCTVVPIVTEPGLVQPPRETGAEWFARQSADLQRSMLGPGGYEAYQAGASLAAFVRVRHDADWGPVLERKRLSEVA